MFSDRTIEPIWRNGSATGDKFLQAVYLSRRFFIA
ncbi:uncharacterized protein METZ01_LOCUS224635, partial [marine metagenome]